MHDAQRRSDPPPGLFGTVVVHESPGAAPSCRYEREARCWMAARLAELKGMRFAGEAQSEPRGTTPSYVVPAQTLLASEASALGIRDEHDLFGGVVPYPFLTTKAITQPLVSASARAPEGWSHAFHARAPDAVLRGFTVFSAADARAAATRLLAFGPFRFKPVRASGGRGQQVMHSSDELDQVLAATDPAEITSHGLVLEENLEAVTTLSLGRVVVGDLLATYSGKQNTTVDNSGRAAYGGSALDVIRGDFDELEKTLGGTAERTALLQARAYDARARELFPSMIVSRGNYDVAQGIDAEGQPRSGVLEQSWRIGGASPAEIVALQVLRAEPDVQRVRASCHEVYGACSPPAGAQVLFSGIDEEVGQITLYAMVTERG